MDVSVPEETRQRIEQVLDRYRGEGLEFHALRTRQAGARAFATIHMLVPGDWTVQKGHDHSERIETDLRVAVPYVHVTTHLEPREDPASLADAGLDRS
jgi:divalent metal cation (Fe/Co/Zn/Cd) transporter